MEKFAFMMQLKPGFEAEYRKRHDEIWPELVQTLKGAGVSDYSIYLEASSRRLFAVLRRRDDHGMDELPENPIVRRWWDYMADIMETEADNSPAMTPLELMFHLD